MFLRSHCRWNNYFCYLLFLWSYSINMMIFFCFWDGRFLRYRSFLSGKFNLVLKNSFCFRFPLTLLIWRRCLSDFPQKVQLYFPVIGHEVLVFYFISTGHLHLCVGLHLVHSNTKTKHWRRIKDVLNLLFTFFILLIFTHNNPCVLYFYLNTVIYMYFLFPDWRILILKLTITIIQFNHS